MRVVKEASLPLSGKQAKVEDVQEVYVEQKEKYAMFSLRLTRVSASPALVLDCLAQ